jgi:hypothetical protein
MVKARAERDWHFLLPLLARSLPLFRPPMTWGTRSVGVCFHRTPADCSGLATWRSLVIRSKSRNVALYSGMNRGSILKPCCFSRCADSSAAGASPISETARRKRSIGFIRSLHVVRGNLGCIGRRIGSASVRGMWRSGRRMGGLRR